MNARAAAFEHGFAASSPLAVTSLHGKVPAAVWSILAWTSWRIRRKKLDHASSIVAVSSPVKPNPGKLPGSPRIWQTMGRGHLPVTLTLAPSLPNESKKQKKESERSERHQNSGFSPNPSSILLKLP